jgi:hypothetical protein
MRRSYCDQFLISRCCPRRTDLKQDARFRLERQPRGLISSRNDHTADQIGGADNIRDRLVG